VGQSPRDSVVAKGMEDLPVKPKRVTVDLNSQIRFAESIYTALIHDVASGRSPELQSSLARDLQTILNRIKMEGMGFCTIALPSLGKAVVKSFRTGSLEVPTAFAVKKGTSLPKLFSGLMKEIYTDEGKLKEHFDIASVTEVRQLCELAYKLDIGYSKEADAAVIDGFIDVERSIRSFQSSMFQSRLCELATDLVEHIFKDFDPKDIVPRHGPGNVATREKGIEKWNTRIRYEQLHQQFPYYEYFVVRGKCLYDRRKWFLSLEKRDRGCARVTLVPKDSRGPRLISLEPLEYQFIQQGLWRSIHSLLRNHPFTQGHVNFRDQRVNQTLAMLGSYYDSWATLDMKDASDRVSLQLVRTLFSKVPRLLRALEATRSAGTELPDGTCVQLWKFAPMGSALCFPIESIVHYVLCVASIMMQDNCSMWEAKDGVFVYGDDLIVMPRHAPGVMEDLESVGLKFNRDKCFLSGPFRESCGVDCLKGHNTAPVRWRKPWPSNQRDAASLEALSDFASLLYTRCYVRAANLVWDQIEQLTGKLPVCPIGWNVGYLRRVTRYPYFQTPHRVRLSPQYQRLEHKALVIRRKESASNLCPYSQLLKFFLYRGEQLKGNTQSELHRLVHGDCLIKRLRTVWQETEKKFSGASKEYSDRSSLKDRWMGIY
jgi:hypothetical protein